MTNRRITRDEAIDRAEHALRQMAAAAAEFQHQMDLVAQTSKRNEEAIEKLRAVAREIGEQQQ